MGKRLIGYWIALVCALLLVAGPVVGQDEAPDAIEALVDDMESAVLDSDADAYLALVDLPEASTFAVEHRNWVANWAEGDYLSAFAMTVSDIEITDDATAFAEMTIQWETPLFPSPGETAIFDVTFVYDDDADLWLYAGERWVVFETERFVVKAAPGVESVAERLIPELPAIYDSVTEQYGYIPKNPMEIKIYTSSQALGATTLLDLPLIGGWNEPAESLKIIGRAGSTPVGVVAHEFTHFLGFDEAGSAHTRMPWWLSEGIAEYTAFSFVGSASGDETLGALQAFHAQNDLVGWDLLADYNVTPVELWGFAYVQGYAFVRYITETYGVEDRNAWLRLMAVEMDLGEASEAVFDKTFEQLDTKFNSWLRWVSLN